MLRENGSGTLAVLESTLAEHQVKLSQLKVLMQLGSTESIKLFLENSDALAIVSVRAVTRELMSGVLKVIDITDFSAERMFSFVQLQGQSGDWKRVSSGICKPISKSDVDAVIVFHFIHHKVLSSEPRLSIVPRTLRINSW